MRIFTPLLFTAMTILCFATGYSQILLPLNTIANEDFNSMGTTATATLPANWRMSPGGNAVGTWAAGVSATTQAASSGLPSAGGRYNFATTAGTDRAVGFITDGSYNTDNAVMAYYKNSTGASVNAVTVSFAVERYVVNTGNFSLSFASSADGITWTPQAAGDISTGNFATGTAAGSFGAPQTITRIATVNTVVPNNGDIYFRWVFTTTNVASQGLGLDNVAVFAGTATPVLTAKLKDTLQVDNVPPANQFNEGDVIRYVTTIKNTGTGNAANVQLNEPAPSNTTFVSGSLKTSAVAVDDNYTAGYNTVLNGTTVLVNDFGVPSPTAVISFGTTSNPVTAAGSAGISDAGATVTVNANGSFTYMPVSGFTGTDQFKYITGNGNLPNNDAVVTVNVAPTASADLYSVVGNTQLVADGQSAPTTPFTASATNILANDGGTGLTVTPVNNAATTNGGSITIDAAGKFTYTPAVGFTGTDTYTYTVTSNNLSATATITFNVSNMVWYVNNTYAGANGAADGRSHRPYTDVAAAEAASAINQVIYVHTGSGNTTGNAVLKTGQTLRGAGTALSVGTLSLAAGTNPTLSGTVTLANNVIIDGFDMNTGTGTAISSTGATAVTVSVGNVTTSGAVNAVTLSTTTGSVIIAGGTQTNATGAVFNISGGTVSLTYSGNAAQGTALQPLVSVSGHATGTITFQTGTISATDGTGLQFNNADGIYNFTGTTTLNGGDAGIDILNGSDGTFTFGTGTAVIKGSGVSGDPAFNLTSSNAVVTYNGGMNFFSNTGSLVNIATHAAGNISFNTGDLIKAQSSTAPAGISITGVTGGTVTFNNPTISITKTNSSGDAISLVNNTGGTINFTPAVGGSGLTLNTLFGGIGFNATGGGTISVTGSANSIQTGTTTALNIANTIIGAGGINFQTVSANGPINGINYTSVTGGATVINGGTITGGAGSAFNVSGGSTNITYAGTINQANAGRLINITGATGGTVLFSGALTGTGTNTGINLTTNTGATINFTGVITLDGAASVFTATGGGTVSATNTTSKIGNTTVPTGPALNIDNTNIGAGGVKFLKISATGGVSGIGLNVTGAAGGLTVIGGGNTTQGGDNSGGTIQTSTGAGISLTNTLSPSFNNMNINNTGNDGISGTLVSNFTCTYSTINNSGTANVIDASNIGLNNTAAGTEQNVTGAINITGNVLTNAWYHGIDIYNYTGTISNATINNNKIQSGTTAGGGFPNSIGSGIRLTAIGNASTVANITKATINNNIINNFPGAAGLRLQGGNTNTAGPTAGTFGTPGSGTNIIDITSNQINKPGNGASVKTGAEGIIAVVNGAGQGNLTIFGNNVQQTTGTSIASYAYGNAVISETIANNTIVSNNTLGTPGIGIGTSTTTGFATNNPNLSSMINGNNVSQTDGNGILAYTRDASGGNLKVTIRNNIVAAPLGGYFNNQGIRIDAGNGTTGDNDVCLDISGNTSAVSVGQPGTGGIGIRKQGISTTVNAFGIKGMAATATPGVENYINGLNPAGGGTLLISATSGFTTCNTSP